MSKIEKDNNAAYKIRKYLTKNHQWTIGVLIALVTVLVSIILVPWGVKLDQNAESEKENNTLSKTETYFFTPTSNVNLAEVSDGADCWTSSGSSNRFDAYRCILGDNIYDPCFYFEEANYVDCPDDPTSHKIFSIAKIEQNRFEEKESTTTIPWYIKLENSGKCRFYTGATYLVAGTRADYGCDNEQVLSLPVENNDGLLTIKCYNKELERVEICKIFEAWY